MREAIYTIPIHDVFGEKCGCPVCRLRKMLEERCTDYILGAAMMEPDVRIETNRWGFCPEHLHQLVGMKNRLSLALMLETRLDEIRTKHMPPKKLKKGESSPLATCFVCREIDAAAEKLLSTALKQYFSDPEFRRLFSEQEYFCMKHYGTLCALAEEALPRKLAAEFVRDLTAMQERTLSALRDDVHAFTKMFDYRNAAASKEDARIRTAVERAVDFLD